MKLILPSQVTNPEKLKSFTPSCKETQGEEKSSLCHYVAACFKACQKCLAIAAVNGQPITISSPSPVTERKFQRPPNDRNNKRLVMWMTPRITGAHSILFFFFFLLAPRNLWTCLPSCQDSIRLNDGLKVVAVQDSSTLWWHMLTWRDSWDARPFQMAIL